MLGDEVQISYRRLGLLSDAQARDIRRAYARELKKIDQALDAAGFQQLRAAYEDALQFAQGRHDVLDDGQETDTRPEFAAAPMEPVATLPRLAGPGQLADAALDAFRATLAQLAVKHAGSSDGPFQDALRHTLAGEHLFGIEARFAFEQHVADLLVDGWRPGHDALLVAAVAVFGWSDGARLVSLGHAGVILDCAIEERAMFDNQGLTDKQAQKRVLRLLRQEALPDASHMAQDIPFFMRMRARFPHWLAIVAPMERITYWDDLCPEPGMPFDPPPEKIAWGWRMVMGCLCLFAVFRCGEMLTLAPALGPASTAPDPGLSTPPGVPVGQDRLDDIVARVDYQPAGDDVRIPREMEFDVFLNPEGKVVGANLIRASGNATLDAAVRAAIMDSAPFVAETSRVFPLTFKYAPPVVDTRKRP